MRPAPWQVAWIAGAGSGIGRALVLDLARAGVKVAASARTQANLNQLAADSPAINAYALDVTDSAGVARAVEAIESALGPIDLAILSAGSGRLLSGNKFDAATVRETLEVNYMGVVHCLEALLPRMIARGGGHIAIMASVAGYRGMARNGAYAPTKAALINLAECLYPDVARFGVTVSVINPGYVDTPMTRGNKAPMPFLISAEDASTRILSGLKRGRFEIAFPWRIVWLLKFARILPYWLYFWVLHRFGMGRR
jgi:NAD(P)-dependent dehydrogenase (short-subunit alcohol dehydrogenase family)